MAETLNVRPRGLYLGPSDPQTPPGGMTSATNTVISRDGIVETRRGQDVVGSKDLSRVWSYDGYLVGWGRSAGLSRSTDGATWTDYATALAPPSDAAIRAIEAQRCLFLTSANGPYRLDSITSEPVRSGVPEALDIGLALGAGTGTAVPTGNQVAYRVAYARWDANDRLIVGGPSSRGVIANSSGSTKDVTLTATLPDEVSSSTHFAQVYRTKASGGASTDPGDEMGLVYEASIPAACTASSLVRTAGTTVTANTTTTHGYTTGTQVRISPGGTVSAASVTLGGSSSIQRSTDNGVTWSSAGITGLPAGTYYAVANGNGYFVAVGVSVSAYSADGLTWSTGSIAVTLKSICYTGARFVAVSDTGGLYYSTNNGSTWTLATASGYNWRVVKWNGSQVLAVGYVTTSAVNVAVSNDGVTWAIGSATGVGTGIEFGLEWDAVTSRWVICGNNNGTLTAWASYSTFPGSTYVFTPAAGISGTGNLRAIANSGSSMLIVGAQAYKSTDGGKNWSTVTWSSGELRSVTWDGTNYIATGSSLAATAGANPSALTSRTIGAGSYQGVVHGGSVDFPAGEYTITATPTATSFEYAQTGTNGTLTANQVVTPLSFSFTDTAPDGFFGAALYTNQNQEGILAANARPPLAGEIATFRGSVFYADITPPALQTIYLLGCSGTNGLQSADTITVNGVVYTAGASESATSRTFLLTTSGSAASNIRDTAASLIRVLNRAANSGVYAQDVSDPSGTPGQIAIWNRDSSASLTVDVSRPSAWARANDITVTPKRWKNGLVWSKTNQPDHVQKVQILQPQQVGASDARILRCVPTRSSLFIFKEDGLWRLTGDAGVWDIQPFDLTVRLVAPETAVALDNTVFALCSSGVLRISDTGVSLVSRQPGACDIEPVTQRILAPDVVADTVLSAFAVPYEADHKYVLAVVDAPTGSYTTVRDDKFYIYDVFMRSWTEWTGVSKHGVVYDDRLWFVGCSNGRTGGNYNETSVRRERRAMSDLDFREALWTVTVSAGGGTTAVTVDVSSDVTSMAIGGMIGDSIIRAIDTGTRVVTLWSAGPGNGSATYYGPVLADVVFRPDLGIGPGTLTKWQSLRLLFDEVGFHSASMTLSNNYSATDSITLDGVEQGVDTAKANASIRVWPSIDVSVGSTFAVGFTHAEGGQPMALAGFALTHEPMSSRSNR